MWNQLESYKNHFLQSKLPHVTAEKVSEMLTSEFQATQSTRYKCRFPSKVRCEHSTYFYDRADLAYGFETLRKLMIEICSDDPLVRWRAINSLSEYLLNPLHAERAMLRKDIIRRTHNMFLRIQHKFQVEHYRESERLMQIFLLLSQYMNGARDIARRVNLMWEFYHIIYTKKHIMYVATKILRNLSEKYEVLLYLLNKTESYKELEKIFQQDPCEPFHPEPLWIHLSHFLEVDPEQGLRRGFFELFHKRITGRLALYHKLNMKCFALLLRCEEGQRRFDKVDGVRLLYEILNTEKLDTFEFVVMALCHGMVSRHALWRCREFTNLPNILVDIAKETDNMHLQLYCLKALRLMSEMPSVKKYVKTVCLLDLMYMKCLNESSECARDEYVEWLDREIYDSSEP